MQTNVLIVGAGPAGTACGIQLRKLGVDCIIIDKSDFPRQKLCAGLLTLKAKSVLRTLLGDEFYDKCIGQCARNYATDLSLWHKDTLQVTIQPQRAITLIDRADFDNFLVSHYVHLGGKLLTGNAVNDVNLEKNIISLSSGEIIQFQTLIAADGANSTVEKILSRHYKDFQAKKKNALCLEINVDRNDLDIQGVNVFFGIVPKSYAWAFSKGDSICVGLIQHADASIRAHQVMLDFCHQLRVKNIDKYPLRGAMLPINNCRKRLSYRNVYFVGDASGLVDPLTGEGIYFALQGGVYLADSLQRKNPANDYQMSTQLLRSLIRKSSFLQKLISYKSVERYFLRNLKKHPEYVKYYYDTQIENISLESLWGTIMHYRLQKIEKKNEL